VKVYLDTNILIDILERREPFFQCSKNVFLLAAEGMIDGIIGASSITDVYYIVKKSRKDSIQALNAVIDLLETAMLVDTTVRDIYTAATSPIADFEDAVIAATSQREGADYIVTRNTDDFSTSLIPAITPEKFLELLKRI
jgi:predicted nucleic acid-binding protein